MADPKDRKLFEAWLKREQPAGCISDMERGWQAARATPAEAQEAVAWIRFCSDNTYEGPIMDRQLEDCRRSSGAWTPLGIISTHPAPDAAAIRAAVLRDVVAACTTQWVTGLSPEDNGWNSGVAACIEAIRALATKGTTGYTSALAVEAWSRRAPAPSPWVSVDERLPEECVTVLVTKDGGVEDIALDFMEEGVWREWCDYVEHVEIIGGRISDVRLYTHWAPWPAPAPAKEDGHE